MSIDNKRPKRYQIDIYDYNATVYKYYTICARQVYYVLYNHQKQLTPKNILFFITFYT